MQLLASFAVLEVKIKPELMKIIRDVIKVAAGVIFDGEKVLLAKRSERQKLPGYWEFPGGKLETGETPSAALVRELREELGVEVKVLELLCEHQFQRDNNDFHLYFLKAEIAEGIPKNIEHEELEWFHVETIPMNKLLSSNHVVVDCLI